MKPWIVLLLFISCLFCVKSGADPNNLLSMSNAQCFGIARAIAVFIAGPWFGTIGRTSTLTQKKVHDEKGIQKRRDVCQMLSFPACGHWLVL